MASAKELQEEEYEVLKSIYEGDEKFTEVSSTTFTYKFESEDSNHKTFAVEFACGENYPEESPKISLDLFYNSSLHHNVKGKIKSFIVEQAQPLLNSAMIYTLIEVVRENIDVLLEFSDIPDEPQPTIETTTQPQNETVQTKQNGKKEQLTKAQKRRLLNKQEKGEFPRGWNWVDIVQHLSQTSQKNS